MWVKDPIWDLEESQGFEDYAEELKAFRLEHEAKMTAQYEESHRRKFFDNAAFATSSVTDNDGLIVELGEIGLTRREYFTAMAMQGLCASGADVTPWIAKNAVAIADATLQYLYDDNQ